MWASLSSSDNGEVAMGRVNKILVILVVAALLPAVGIAQEKVGTTGVNFLKIGATARGVAMADAFLAIADDASALYYNPGGLVNLTSNEMIFTHLTMPAGINYDFIGGVYPMPAMGSAVGISFTTLYTDDMVETTPERPYGTGRTFNATDFAGGISYAQRLTDKFSVGGTVKYIQENLADEVARGWSADVGTYYDTGWKSLKIAMIITNFGPDMEHISTPFPLPLMFRFGVSANVLEQDENRVTLGFEGIHPNDNREELHMGVEYAYKEFAFLRMGKKMNGVVRDSWDDFQDDKENLNPYIEYPLLSFDGYSFGGGIYLKRINLSLDYAWANYGYFGSLHRFSLGYKFNQ